MKNTAKYAWSFSRNSSFLRGLLYYAAPCTVITIILHDLASWGPWPPKSALVDEKRNR